MKRKVPTKKEGLTLGLIIGYVLGVFIVVSLGFPEIDGWIEYIYALPFSVVLGFIGWIYPKCLSPVFYIFYFLPF